MKENLPTSRLPTTSYSSLEQFLRKSIWMSQLPAAACDRVCEDCFYVEHKKGAVVAHRGELVDSWVGVMDGLIKVVTHHRSGKAVMFSGIPKNAWVGEGSVIKREPRRYDLVAMSNSRTAHVPRATFQWLLDTSFEFNHFITGHLNERLGQFMAMTETDRIADPTIRLARSICGLFNPVLYPGVGPVIKVSQEELGDFAGLSRQRVNAALGKLEDQGLIQVAYGGIYVEDLSALKAFADFH